MLDALRTLFRTSFTNLSFTKLWMMRLAVIGAVVGGAVFALDARESATAAGVDWSHLSFTSGVGFVGGFMVGATVRLFLKVAFWIGVAFVALGYGLSYVGLLDLPWSSWGQAMGDVGAAIERSADGIRDFLSGLLPAGSAAVIGLGSGLTQRPQFDDDTD
ncbi:MAG: hypothetical protein R3F49_05625 [Planctomycetota bacterium]